MLKNKRGLSLGFLAVFFIAQVFSITAALADESKPARPDTSSSSAVPVKLAESPKPETVAQPTEASKEEPPATPASSQGNVTIDFKDADIQNVLRILSYKAGVNIVAGKDVTGIVTIRLVDVPWEKALDVVLKTYGYAYDRDGDIIRVTTVENLKKEELSTEVFVLNYSQASEVEKSLKDVLSERGKVRSDTRSNMIIVTDMPTTLQRVKKVVERLDKITPQVVIEAKVIETTLGDSEQLGIKWNTQASISGSARPTTLPFPARQQSEWSRFMPEGRAPVTSVQTDTSGNVISTSTTSDFPVGAPGSVPNFPVVDKAEFKFGTVDFTQFQAMLQMIKNRTDSKILSEPHITTLNNQEAKVLVGEIIAIPTFERNQQTGHMEITGYKDKELGIRLSVTPQINSENEIVVSVVPEITSLLGYDTLAADIKAPHYATRSANTRVRIKNGQTIAIGGLIRENTIDSKNKVPILGDLPLLGKIFSHTDKTVQKTDLLFFVTVNIVSDKTDWAQGHASKL
ncbi:MAG: hypothetical protein AUJ72_03485 [Candidatus Omnitrophica bacterium CG1_02_46_14]|nr:MAG: hypothetical protein AUJ72_03485 [Candidatus Omnitrophica bacterium CG1_02_46_14]